MYCDRFGRLACLARLGIPVIVLLMVFAGDHAPAQGNDVPAEEPHLTIRVDSNGIAVSGLVSSVAHEALLRVAVGPADGGTSNDRIATLADFEPINFGDAAPTCPIAERVAAFLNWMARMTGSTHRLQTVQAAPALNLMAAALALPDEPNLVMAEIAGIGLPTGASEPMLGQEVQKMGRTTGVTKGTISQISVTVDVNYADRTARFTDQVFTTPMSSPGDSGSSILNMERQVVGLLFAGSERVTIITPIQRVLDRFEVDVITV